LRRAERYGGLLSASGTGGLCFNLGIAVRLAWGRGCSQHSDALALACLTAFRFVLELFIVEEKLFPSGENKIAPTVDTLQHLVLKFHRGWLPSARLRAPTREERTAVVHRKYEVVYYSPLKKPLDSAHHAHRIGVGTAVDQCREVGWCKRSLLAAQYGGGQIKQSRPGTERPFVALVLFLACLFAGPFTSQRSFHTLLLAGLQVKGVTLDLLNYVFLLHLALEPTKSVLEGFSLLKPNFSQTYTPPDSSGRTL
jgi:hypothetical protein